MIKKLRTCSCCLTQYEYCNQCEKDKNKPHWYFAFCSENCKDIYEVISKYEDKQIDVNIAKEQLNKLNLSKLGQFGESYKKAIYSIMDKCEKKTVVVKGLDLSDDNKEDIVANNNKGQKKKPVSKSPLNETIEEVIE